MCCLYPFVFYHLQRQDSIPVTFTTPESFIKVHGIVRSRSMNVTLDFRTYSEDGLIMYNEMESGSFVKVGVSRVNVFIYSRGISGTFS